MSTFSFQLTEQTLRAILEEMAHYPKAGDEERSLQISIDLVPDGIGFEAFNQKAQIVIAQSTAQAAIPKAFLAAFESEEEKL